MIAIFYLIAGILIIGGIIGAINHSSKKPIVSNDVLHPTNPNLKYCRHCNNEVALTAIVCPKCGGSVSDNVGNDSYTAEAVISFLIPLIGFIIYASNSTSNPAKAKKVLSAALWGIGVGILGYVLMTAI